ncbi:ATP-binding protein [Brachybacterium hainanense]|uniref:ATP-binding protein n=1 Tax=Brachybacterium hainanense TaxID=1541174 RepID=A0ABV6RCE8_9MICO
MENPFRPSFGAVPVALAGRSFALDSFEHALEDHPGSEQRSTLISGARGTGKTVLLTEMEMIAQDQGWEVLRLHTAAPSLAGELRELVLERLREVDPEASDLRISGGGIASIGSVRTERVDRYAGEMTTATALARLAELAGGSGGGLLLSVDEVQSVDLDELAGVTQLYQDLVRTGRPVAFVGAGIRSGIEALLGKDKATFLRRAHRVELGTVDLGTAAETIRLTVAGTAKRIGPEAAVLAGEISCGYPYLIQYVGAQAFENSADAEEIALEDVARTRGSAIRQMHMNVHGPALRGIAPGKLAYLEAMLEDDGPSSTAEIGRRLGRDHGYQSVYRRRLIEEDLIEPAGRGYVRFSLPYLRDSLLLRRQEHPGPDSPPDVTVRRTRSRSQEARRR